MPRIRTQLAIQATPELLARVKGAATARGQTVTRLLIDWIEAGLAGDLPAHGGGSDLVARVAALEAAVADLRRPASPERVSQSPPKRMIPAPQVGEHQSPDGAITTAELAAQTGTNRGSWNNWASAEKIGQARTHSQAGAWLLVGQAPPPGGGPLRWLWKPA